MFVIFILDCHIKQNMCFKGDRQGLNDNSHIRSLDSPLKRVKRPTRRLKEDYESYHFSKKCKPTTEELSSVTLSTPKSH